MSVAAAYIAVLALLLICRPDFFQTRFAATWVAAIPTLVVAVGMTLVVVARHIDISVGSQLSVCAVVAGLASQAGCPMPVVAALAILSGAAMGAINGLLVAGLGFPSIVATLATMVMLQSGLRWMRQGQSVYGLPSDFQWFGLSQFSGRWAVVLIGFAVFILAAWATRWLVAARAVYAVGSDAEAARLAGLRPPRVVFAVFLLTGALTGLAALLGAVRFAQVDPNVGLGLELQVIAAVIVGGAAISGGRGTLIGTFVGVALLGTIGAALGFLTDAAYWDRALQGLVILLAVASDGLGRTSGASPR